MIWSRREQRESSRLRPVFSIRFLRQQRFNREEEKIHETTSGEFEPLLDSEGGAKLLGVHAATVQPMRGCKPEVRVRRTYLRTCMPPAPLSPPHDPLFQHLACCPIN